MSDKDSKGELKPCPFHKTRATYPPKTFYEEIRPVKFWGVRCGSCPAQIDADYKTEEEAVERWNTRPMINQLKPKGGEWKLK